MSDKIRDISLILKDLLKVIKVVSMYPEDNSLPQSLKRSFSEKLESIIEEYGDIKILVDKEELVFDHQPVFRDKSKEESLASIFFETGITNFTFKSGLEVAEIYALLDVIKKYLNSPGQKEDLVSLFWEANIPNFKFTTIEDISLAEYNVNLDGTAFNIESNLVDDDISQISNNIPINYKDIFTVNREENKISLSDTPLENDQKKIYKIVGGHESQPGQTRVKTSNSNLSSNDYDGQPIGNDNPLLNLDLNEQNIFSNEGIDPDTYKINEAAKAMGLESTSTEPIPDTTLIFNKEVELSREEETIINQLTTDDASFDPYESTLELLKELLHQETETPAFNETVTICEKIMNDFIVGGKLLEASLLLQYMKKFSSKIAHKKPMWSERIKEAVITSGSREKLKVLSQSLNNHPEIGVGFLRQYLDNFGWEALIGLTGLIPELKNPSQKDALCDLLAVTGKKNINIISRGIDDKNPEIVKNCVIVLSRIDSNQTIKYLSKVVNHNNRDIRLTLAESLKDSELKDAIEILKNLAIDKDPEIRKVAVSSLSSKHGPEAFEAIAEIINKDDFEEIDRNDQQMLFNAFSILGGDIAVTYLLKLILRYNLIGSSTLKFYRAAAFEALSLNRSEKADQVLVKLSNNWRPSIKQSAQKTLDIRRSVMYGGEDE